jgi:DNA-3-methyladenine glycosylase
MKKLQEEFFSRSPDMPRTFKAHAPCFSSERACGFSDMLKNSGHAPDFSPRVLDIVAKELLGKTLVRRLNGEILKARIVETEAYFGDKDPASRAFKGKNKISEIMWSHPGTIMVYNVHKYLMFNVITGRFGEPSGVLVRALEPINFSARCTGPGLLTDSLRITKSLHGKSIIKDTEVSIMDSFSRHEVGTSLRIGVSADLERHFRFFMSRSYRNHAL